jgi:hypothetical protein
VAKKYLKKDRMNIKVTLKFEIQNEKEIKKID